MPSSFLANFALIFLCLGMGILLRRTGKLPRQTPETLNQTIFWISLPAATLLQLHSIPTAQGLLHEAYVVPVLMPWFLFLAAALFFGAIACLRGWDRRTLGSMLLVGGLGNTSFVGFPLLTAIYGPESLRTGILADQPGSFLVLATLGLLAASICAAKNASGAAIARRILTFPPFVAMIAALALLPWAYPAFVTELLEKLSATLIPLALLSVGYQLNLKPGKVREYATPVSLVLLFKLILGPVLVFLLFALLVGARGEPMRVTQLQSAMAPMITGAVIADEYGLEPELANLAVSIGIPLSLLTVPIWAWLIRSF